MFWYQAMMPIHAHVALQVLSPFSLFKGTSKMMQIWKNLGLEYITCVWFGRPCKLRAREIWVIQGQLLTTLNATPSSLQVVSYGSRNSTQKSLASSTSWHFCLLLQTEGLSLLIDVMTWHGLLTLANLWTFLLSKMTKRKMRISHTSY